jgi:hypothetical protein
MMNITKILNNNCDVVCDCGDKFVVSESESKTLCTNCGYEATTSILVRKFYESGMNGQWQEDVAERKKSVQKKFQRKYPNLEFLIARIKKRDPNENTHLPHNNDSVPKLL